METRKITIVSTKNQKKYVINSEAETLGELKDDLAQAGIDYTDMTFMEGLTKTELVSDESVLPTNVPYTNRSTGETTITNELVFMLTNANKKISSGTDRSELYQYIKEHNLQAEIKDIYNKPYTNVPTADLQAFVDAHTVGSSESVKETVKPTDSLREKLEELYDEIYSTYQDFDVILSKIGALLNEPAKEEKETDSPYSDDEIDDMFNF